MHLVGTRAWLSKSFWFLFSALCLQALARRLVDGEEALYELIELSGQQLVQPPSRGTAAGDLSTTSTKGAVALVAPASPEAQLEEELQQSMVQAAKRLEKLQL